MKTLIVYYSLGGTTRRLARQLAEKLNADVSEIKCPRYGAGTLNYLRAGFDGARKFTPQIEMPKAPAGYDAVLIGGPVWVSTICAPLRSYLSSRPSFPEKIGLFLTSGGGAPQTNAVAHASELAPVPFAATLVLKDSTVKANGAKAEIDRFVQEIGAAFIRPGVSG
ncbi:flavodoxin [Actibacterium lipolyticum]|uniref:Flavodoxin n=1 Tax=Actibacterium lipolyticum TaxID=1524263 RepID=A0A238KME6_9RHOB|nr:hypothetical protein [Actibacterium lipolyticum]SMX43888.1 flavodoxin [Actibacterium lipolyticum]